jgi:uncharacterized protein (TIGR00255 family)
MIRSMTGYGRSELRTGSGTVTAEIKSVNHRFFDFTGKLPSDSMLLENKIKEFIRAKIKRGKITFFLGIEASNHRIKGVSVNRKIIKGYCNILKELRREFRLKDDIGLSHILALPDVITFKQIEEGATQQWKYIKKALEVALAELVRMKEREGKVIYNDLLMRANDIEKSIRRIEARIPRVIMGYRQRLVSRVKEIGCELSDERLEPEVLLFARNSEITEEIIRLYSHTEGFKKALAENGDVGRKLDFIAQELYREVNTIGAKAGDFKTSEEVVKIKSQIDRIREQVQNVE